MLHDSHTSSGLHVDLYHIDSAFVAWRSGINQLATFDLYTRHTPFGGAFLLTAGLELALDFASSFHFSDDNIAFLRARGTYDDPFLSMLRQLRFTGEILALPEGEIAFANEPLLRVTAPFIEALFLESGLLHIIGVSTLIATKAARIVHAAAGRPIAEFGFRRAQAPFLASRSAYIGGCVSTSFVAAARKFGIPSSGTIPLALVQAFPTEADAFRAVAESLDHYSLLLDTYDIDHAIRTAVEVARDVNDRLGHKLTAVRLDSGELEADSRLVRAVLDAAGLHDVRILASGDLDEWRVRDLVRSGAKLDGFGVGTSLATGAGSAKHGVDGGALGAVYKLVWYEGAGSPARIKIAGDKSTWPGKKQVARIGAFERDLIQLESESLPGDSRPLLTSVMRNGRVTPSSCPPLAGVRGRAIKVLNELPSPLQELDTDARYPVERSPLLIQMRDQAIASHSTRDQSGASPVKHPCSTSSPAPDSRRRARN